MQALTSVILCFILVTPSLSRSEAMVDPQANPIDIDHQLIKIMDRLRKLDVQKLLQLQNGLTKLLVGDNGRGLIEYQKEKYSILTLAQLEKSPEKKSHSHFQVSLKQALELLRLTTDGYMKEARGHKPQMVILIEQWSKQRARPHTLLLDWGHQADGKEHDHLKKLIHNFYELEVFVKDLVLFLRDLRWSCKESWEEFKKKLKN